MALTDHRPGVPASNNPSWIWIAALVGYSAAVFVLQAAGVGEARLVFAFPVFCATYLWFATRFVIVDDGAAIHLLTASRFLQHPRKDLGRIAADDVDLIEQGLSADRWAVGSHELAVARRHRNRLIKMVNQSS